MKAQKFAHKYGKKYGGNLYLEGSMAGNEVLSHEKLPNLVVPDRIVVLTGYVEYSAAKARKEGVEGKNIKTGYVTSLAVYDSQLYAITVDSVYRVYGKWMAEVITQDPFLKSLWDDVKAGVLAQASKKA